MTALTACPVCQQRFAPVGRQKFCSGACRAAAYRRRRSARPAFRSPAPDPAPAAGHGRRVRQLRQAALGERQCPDCASFTRTIGIGGNCPCCHQPVSVTELFPQEVVAAD